MLQYLLNYGLQQVWQQTLRYFFWGRDHQLSTSIRRKKSLKTVRLKLELKLKND